jgi:hypothetical protein
MLIRYEGAQVHLRPTTIPTRLLPAVDRRSSAIIVSDCVLLAIQCTIAQPVNLYSMARPQSVHLCHPHPYTALGPLLPGDQVEAT